MSRRNLTPRERAVVELVADGLTNAQIARSLGISVSTTKQNLANILIKWNCTNRTQVAVEATRRAAVSPAQPLYADQHDLLDDAVSVG